MKKAASYLLTALLPFALLLAGMRLYQCAFPPSACQPPSPPAQKYDRAALEAAVTPGAVRATQAQILALGSRFMGQDGFYRMADFMRARYAAAGLELHELQLQDVAPRTVTRTMDVIQPDAAGGEASQAVTNVEIYPFLPNHLQPMVTPPEGLRGKLVLLDPAMLRTNRDFRGCIGLLNTQDNAYDSLYGFDWTQYAALGLRALIVAHPDGFEKIPWARVASPENGMVSAVSVNFVRLAATPGIFQYAGREIRLRVKTVYESVPHTVLAGVLRSRNPAKSAHRPFTISTAIGSGGCASASRASCWS